MAVALAGARQAVAVPVRKERKFGLFSVVDVVDSGDTHWMLGGLTSDGEECSGPKGTSIVCGPTATKTSESWYADLDGDPWLAYMFETCRTVGRYEESAARLRTRFLASEQSAVETEFQDNVMDPAATDVGAFLSVTQAIGSLEAHAATQYGGQIILHLGFLAAEEAFSSGGVVRVGDHLETHTGSLVAVGNYHADHLTGSDTAPVIYATGATTLYRSALVESGPVLGSGAGGLYTNEYFTLIERGYAALIDCYTASATGLLCDCGTP